MSTTSSSVLSMVMTGGGGGYSAPCTRMLVFLKLIVSPNSLQAWYEHHVSFGFGAESGDVEEFAV